jgi:hypothetical protein
MKSWGKNFRYKKFKKFREEEFRDEKFGDKKFWDEYFRNKKMFRKVKIRDANVMAPNVFLFKNGRSLGTHITIWSDCLFNVVFEILVATFSQEIVEPVGKVEHRKQ